MGRPLRKDIFGVDVIGTFIGNTGVRIAFHDGVALRDDGIIIKQRGAKTFVVAQVATPLTVFTCVVQSTVPSALSEMQLMGYIGGNASVGTPLAKITKRIATDFSGVRYRWRLENDSTNDYIVLERLG